MISIPNIELSEVLGAVDLIKQFPDQGKRVTILRSDFIETSIIYIEA
jgi:hypothetical protein